ncbi:MAG: hypothetical protein ACT4TC_15545 [Myxococcaceae bacterium]
MPRLALLSALLLLAACSGSEARVFNSEEEAASVLSRQSEIHYLGEEVSVSEVEVPTRAQFQSITFAVSSDPAASLEMQVQRADGTWTAWTPVSFEWREDRMASTHQVLAEVATGIRVRAQGEAQFVKLELFSGVEPQHDDDVLGESEGALGASLQELRRAGMWQMPPEVSAIAQTQFVPYVFADRCGGGLRPGTRALGDFLLRNFKGPKTYAGYACRQIVGGTGLSLHATGRALDLMIPTDGTQTDRGSADNDKGNPIGNWLAMNAEYIGITFIIWDQADWSANRNGEKLRPYSGAHPHNDHLHIELSKEAAEKLTQFYKDGMPVPGGPAVPAPIAAPVTLKGCASPTVGREVPTNTCVQSVGDGQVRQCKDGAWVTPFQACATPSYTICDSVTLGKAVPVRACVQSRGDQQWRQCIAGGAWATAPNATVNQTGPMGACQGVFGL